jgi:TonB-linked SusC/RagA family outer membrane protein
MKKKSFPGREKPHYCFSKKLLLIMKLSALLLFVGLFQVYASVSYSQVAKLNLNVSEKPVSQILDEIEQQSEFYFLYNNKLVDVKRKVSIKANNRPIALVLDDLFKGSDVKYTVVDRQIILTSKEKLPEIVGEKQQKRVTGTVTDASTGESLPGVNIVIDGTTTGVVTDADGKYAIEVPSASSALIFSYVGYNSQKVNINGQSIINQQLIPDIQKLDEVVVIGYGTQKKKDLTTSVVSVSNKEIENRPITSAAQAIEGKAAGVQVVQPSGKPGADLSIRVRGATSVQAGNEPLYVVDGVPTTDISALNASDIENMQILKDASSAAIYGARAANGVVLITTKHGNKNAPTMVQLNAYTGISKIGKTLDVLNTRQYAALMNEIGIKLPDGTNLDYNTDWNKETFSTGHSQNYQVSITGGSDKTTYYVSGGYLNDKGIVQPAEYNRYSFRTNLENQTKQWLKLSSNISFTHSSQTDAQDNASSGRGGIILSALNTPPFMHVYDPDNSEHFDPNPFQNSWESPVAYMSRSNITKNNRFLGNTSAEVTFFKGLSLKSSFGLDYTNYQNDQYIDPIRTSYGREQNGIGSAEKSNNLVWLNENILTYTASFDKHNLSVMAGNTLQSSWWGNSYMSGKDFPKNTAVHTMNAANQITNAGTTESEWGIESYLSRVMYNYDSKYLFTANFRYDGSSKLSSNNRWGFFPSLSAGWRLSAEPFMAGLTSVINDLKLRAGWGKNGNQEGLDNYSWYGKFNINRVPATDPLSGPTYSRATIENKDLKWETTTQSNIGLDLAVFNNRIVLNVDAYMKKTKDLLLNVPLPSSAGVSYITRNDGEMENKGLELSLTSHNLTGPFVWTTDFNISFNRNKVTKLNLAKVYNYANIESNNENIIILKEGVSLGTFYGYVSQGVDPETGDMIYKDLNNNGFTDPGDRTVIGNAQPKFIYGLTNSFSFMNIDFSFFLQGSKGNDIFNASRIDTEGMFDSKNQTTDVLRRWERPGMVTDIPRASGSGSTYNVHNSTRFVEDGSYLRLKSVTLSYNLPKTFIQKVGLGKAAVYVTGQNLLTITKYKGFDPEVNAYGNSGVELGVDYGTYPQSKTVIFGINLEF